MSRRTGVGHLRIFCQSTYLINTCITYTFLLLFSTDLAAANLGNGATLYPPPFT
jgi:hypothetical protein